MSLENRIHELRKERNLSQEQLAEKIGVARQTISKWELGETAPDIKQARLLANFFGVSLEELLSDEPKESLNTTQKFEKSRLPWSKIIIAGAITICLCLFALGAFNLARCHQILHPQGVSKEISINREGQIHISNGETGRIVFKEDGKPAIACKLPDGFTPTADTPGLYTDEQGSFIKFNADYAASIVNPLLGTRYYSYYEDHGYQTYIDMVRLAMYYNLPHLAAFSSEEELYLAGGAQLIRQQLCAGRDADYYELGGELRSGGDEMLICGFALHFEDTTWLITLKDYEDNYYFITVKDPDGIGKSINTLVDFLSSIYAGDAIRYFTAKDSAAMQSAIASYKEYYAIDMSDGEKDQYDHFIYKINDRFVAIHNGSTKVFDNSEEALASMIDDADVTRLFETCVENLWAYEPK